MNEMNRISETLGRASEAIRAVQETLREQQERDREHAKAWIELRGDMQRVQSDIARLENSIDHLALHVANLTEDSQVTEISPIDTEEKRARTQLWRSLAAAVGGGAGVAGIIEAIKALT